MYSTTVRHSAAAAVPANAERVIRDMTEWLRGQLEASGQHRFVIGLSGGIDSAVVAALACRAVGPARVLLVGMPYAPDLRAPLPSSITDARAMVEELSRQHHGATIPFLSIHITDRVNCAWEDLCSAVSLQETITDAAHASLAGDTAQAALVRGNLKARERAVTLRGLANMTQGLVLGTENRTENLLGYFTIGGDEETDLEVLSPFYKTDVRWLAAALGVPEVIRTKAPSADLWAGQTDEGELGVTYDDADAVLRALQGGVARGDISASTGVSPEMVARVLARHDATAFKRAPRPNYPGFPSDGITTMQTTKDDTT